VWPEIMQVHGDRGAGAWLRTRGVQVTRVTITGAAHDIDMPR